MDALEGDDTIDVLSTAPGVETRVFGGLGSDTINVGGDVVGDVFARDIEGTSGTVNHLVTSNDPNYNGLVADGVNVDVARAGQGQVVITESDGFTALYEGGCFATPMPAPQAARRHRGRGDGHVHGQPRLDPGRIPST